MSSKSVKKTGKNTFKIGALAAVGGIAWKAYKSYSDQEAEDKSSLFDEMRNPLSIEQLVDKVPCSEAAAEDHAISALAIDLSGKRSRLYLDKLARMLSIPPRLQHALDQTANDARLAVYA